MPFALLALMRVEVKKALPLSLLALIPDLDTLFHIHRSISHSIVIPLVVVVPLLLLLQHRMGNPSLLALAFLTVGSHSILDLFTNYTPILWPVYGSSIWLQIGLIAHMGSSPILSLTARLLLEPTSFQPFRSLDAPLATGEGLIVSMMLLAPPLFKTMRNKPPRTTQDSGAPHKPRVAS